MSVDVQRVQQALDRAHEVSAELARLVVRLERLSMPGSESEAREAWRLIGKVISGLNARMELA